MFLFKKLKRLYLWFLLLVFLFHYSYGTTTSLPACGTIAEDALCSLTSGTVSAGHFCISSEKIYQSATENSASICTQKYPASGTTSTVAMFELDGTLYKQFTDGDDIGENIHVLIYTCDDSTCTQFTEKKYLSSKNKLYKCTDGKCVYPDTDTDYYDTTTEILYRCTTSGDCTQSKNTNYYDGTILYNCPESGVCKEITEKKEGFYFSGPPSSKSYSELIECNNNSDKIIECKAAAQPPRAGYYINAQDSAQLISCTSTSPITCSAVPSPSADDGTAYLDAGSFNTNYKGVIECTKTESGGTTTVGCTTTATPSPDLYFVDATDATKIITCNTSECKSDTPSNAVAGHAYIDGKTTGNVIVRGSDSKYSSKSSGATDGKPTYFIDGSESTLNKIITCTSTNGSVTCTSASGGGAAAPAQKFYIDGSDSSSKKIITCDGTKCQSADGATAENQKKIYIDASDGTGAKLITCTTSGCSSAPGGTTAGHAYIDGGNPTYVIKCVSDQTPVCTSTAGDTTGKAYIDGNDTNKKSIITCTSTAPAACSSTDMSEDISKKNLYFIDGGDASAFYTKIISCDSTNGCSSISGNTTVGTAYVDGGKEGNLIICTGTGSATTPVCSSAAGVAVAETLGIGYIDGTDNKKVITCKGTTCSSNDSGATAASTGTPSTPAKNTYYIDGTQKDTNLKYPNVITCTSVGCTSGAGSVVEGHTYIDYSDYKNNMQKIISCTDNGCASINLSGKTLPLYFIDGSDAKNNFKKIITCDSTACSSTDISSKLASSILYYIDGSNAKLENIITCKSANGCSTSKGSNVAGQAYMDASKVENVITCQNSNSPICATKKGKDTAVDTYINAGNPSEIINCNDTKCTLFSNPNARPGRSEYYPTLAAGATSLLKCTYSETEKKAICEKLTDIVESTVFINGLFGKTDGDTTHQLIRCDKSKSCKAESVTVTEGKMYYPNSDTTNTEPFTDDLIVCEKVDSKEKCSITSGRPKQVYLNGNFDTTDNVKQLIQCDKSCVEIATTKASSTALEYYVNAGASNSEKLKDTLILCNDASAACAPSEATDKDIYINAADASQLIQCSTAHGCQSNPSRATEKKSEIYLNSSDLNASSKTPLTSDLIKCTYVKNLNKVTCAPADGVANDIYINSYNKAEIIQCLSTGCATKPSGAEKNKPEYYINADATDSDNLSGDLIKCKNNNNEISCEVSNGRDGDVFLNYNYSTETGKGDNTNQLIKCTENGGCQLKKSAVTEANKLEIYINSGNALSDSKLMNATISCLYESDTSTVCEIKEAPEYSVYLNSGDNKDDLPLIKCNKSDCKLSKSLATKDNNEYYLNAGDWDESALKGDVIECTLNNASKVVCTAMSPAKAGVYLNSNYSENGDKKQLIQCTDDSGCVGRVSETANKNVEYFVNAESEDLTNAIIFCSNKKCVKQTPEDTPSYYVGVDNENPGLIECVETEESGGARRKRGTKVKSCALKSAFTSQGYYLNSGYNKSVNQTIICDSSDGCQSLNVDLGYYVNAGDLEKNPVIVCDKEGSECTAESPKSCPKEEDAVAGQYCYDEGQLKFFTASNTTAIAATKSEDYYVYATIGSGKFPGIKNEISTLFKVSRYYIVRFYQSGVVMIDKNNKLVDNLSTDQNDIALYDCNDTTKVCIQRPGCTPDTYMYDSENRKAIFCNAGKMEYAVFTGYVVDSNRLVGSNHPYVIYCKNGEDCSSIKPKVDSYYVNMGNDSNTKTLIQCSSNNCITVTADVGYYVGHQGEGIIKCSSSTSCVFNKSGIKVKYVNSGFNKSTYAIIECSKAGCNGAKAKVGYYLTYSSSLLIQCTSASNCVEFTPTVNYYDNADSSESSNSIINCVKNSQIVTCAAEATNNGFYMSSVPNVLIRCKNGSKCRTVTVKNGIFRGALKSSSGGSKREVVESDVELEEDGRSVAMPRDSDESYGIIRCVAGKCSALSPSEVAAIPVCEFNNNKCYITLEYAMTKSATTSISAGNICTNTDRSVFYFATDTIVVKPNVISGVTATYVFTTTNSNCLEVNDSYNDMYFTVGSNIFLLDQGSVLQFYESGYYFINTEKNMLVNGNVIDNYNADSVKLYRCNGSGCSIIDRPNSLTYYADVNKRILKYNVNSDAYSFAYEKDVTCIFNNNKCTPNADLRNQEFCITYKGELVLATTDIKSRETGDCYKANSINSNIYGYSQYLYSMNIYSAEMVDQTGYYIISLSTNTTVVSKNYKTKNNNIVVYGCQLSNCKVYEPEESTYYYDAQANTILRYKDGVWRTPETSGYAFISIDPSNTHVYRFTRNNDGTIKINSRANYGYYYTVDNEMYNCDRGENGDCSLIEDTGYYFTNQGEVYYCIYDSEELEPTECTKQACFSGQYYYIEEAYYRCEANSVLVPVISRYCSYNDNVIVNFPLAISEELPDKIKQAVESVEKNNNSTAIISVRGKNFLKSVSGIFTNCTYNVEETKSSFDLVCVNNYVAVDEETSETKICSLEQLGYVECIEDENNPEKCNVSGNVMILRSFTFFTILLIALSIIFQF